LVGVNDTVWLYDLKTIRSDNKPIVPPFRYPFAQVLADRRPLELALSRSGDRVLFGTVDRVIIRGQIAPARPIVALWDVDSGDAPPVLDGKGMDIHCVALSPDGRYALTGDRDRMVYIWDLEKHDRQSQKSLAGHTDAVEAVCFSPDGRRALSGGRDKTICWWDLDERRLLGSFTGHERWVTCVAFAPDGRRVLSGSDDATARVWSLDEPGRPPLVLKGHDGSVRCVAFAPDGRRALTGGDDATLRLWRLEDGAEIARFSHELPVVAVAFSPDGRYALSVGKDNAVWRWELPE
jgi:WD40 repeat protein